jgi:hypothetical protein
MCRFSWVNVTVRLQAIEKPVTSKLLVEHSEKRIHAAAKHVGMVRVWFFLLSLWLGWGNIDAAEAPSSARKRCKKRNTNCTLAFAMRVAACA